MHHFCAVPGCPSTSEDEDKMVSFFTFPNAPHLVQQWTFFMSTYNGTVYKNSRICSVHFTNDQFSNFNQKVMGFAKRLRLMPGAVPTLPPLQKYNIQPDDDHWDYWGMPRRESAFIRAATGLGPDGLPVFPLLYEEEMEAIAASTVMRDHDYCSAPKPGALDAAAARIQQLEDVIKQLPTLRQEVHFHRFCTSDKDIRFYTRFTSREVFCDFWDAIQPSASTVFYWSKAQKLGHAFEPISEPVSPSPTRKRTLRLVDEFFLFCCRVAAGLQEKVLANMFQVSLWTVSRVVITWANYLYLLLGSLPLWMSKRQIKETMPSRFKQYTPDVRVIIDYTEVRCQNPSPSTEVFSSYKNITTFKGLIGIAPCSAVTFVSSLFPGSIPDRELTERSGLLDLLEPGDGCLADIKGFTIEKLLADRGAKLIVPTNKMTAQSTTEDALKQQAMARLRTLVDRAIRRVKQYLIWEHPLPLSLSGTANQLWTVCCLMTNLQGARDKPCEH